jgi:peptidoglycan/LPS O-acetylase OafA/YrhL
MSKKSELAIIFAFIIITVIRFIKIENISFNLLICILGFCVILSILSLAKYKGNKIERSYLTILTILLIFMIVLIIIGEYLKNNYLFLSMKYNSIIIILIGIAFLCFIGLAIANAVYKYNKNN